MSLSSALVSPPSAPLSRFLPTPPAQVPFLLRAHKIPRPAFAGGDWPPAGQHFPIVKQNPPHPRSKQKIAKILFIGDGLAWRRRTSNADHRLDLRWFDDRPRADGARAGEEFQRPEGRRQADGVVLPRLPAGC